MYQHRRKIVILGPAASGKTQIHRRFFSEEKPDFNSTYTPTIGVELSTIDRADSFARTWDTAGEERYATMVGAYLKDVNQNGAFIFTVDSTKSLSDQEAGILNFVRQCAVHLYNKKEKPKVILARTKIDLEEECATTEADMEDLRGKVVEALKYYKLSYSKKEIAIVSCSSKTMAGEDELLDLTIARPIVQVSPVYEEEKEEKGSKKHDSRPIMETPKRYKSKKIVILGPAGSGKTQILRFFSGEKVNFNSQHTPTIWPESVRIKTRDQSTSSDTLTMTWETPRDEKNYTQIRSNLLGGIAQNGALIFTVDSTRSLSDQEAAILSFVQDYAICRNNNQKPQLILARTKTDLEEECKTTEEDLEDLREKVVKKLQEHKLSYSKEDIAIVSCSGKTEAGKKDLLDLTIFRSEESASEYLENLRETLGTTVIETLTTEKERLKETYKLAEESKGAPDLDRARDRLQAIETTIEGLTKLLSEWKPQNLSEKSKKQLQEQLKSHIDLTAFDKRHKDARGTAAKVGRVILNVLLCISIIGPFIKKYAPKEKNTAGYWFSLAGKTHQAGEKALKQIDDMFREEKSKQVKPPN